MLSLNKINLNNINWQRLDQFEDRTIFQTLPWLNFLKDTQGAEPIVIEIKDDGKILGYFTGLIIKKFCFRIIGSPFKGWTTEYMGFNLPPDFPHEEILKILPSFAFHELGCHYMEIIDRHIKKNDFNKLPYHISYFKNFEIDLTKSEDELYAKMDKKSCQWCIRKAEKSGVIIEEAHDTNFADDYYAQLIDVFNKQSLVPTYGIERVKKLINHLHPTGNLLLLRAKNNEGICIATGIFPAFNDTMYFWGAASWRSFQNLRPNELLIWHAMKYWKSRGIKKFDMGGGGDYKKKYGVHSIEIPRFIASKYRSLIMLRNRAKFIWKIRQKFKGKLR
jgi:hypothetical protein